MNVLNKKSSIVTAALVLVFFLLGPNVYGCVDSGETSANSGSSFQIAGTIDTNILVYDNSFSSKNPCNGNGSENEEHQTCPCPCHSGSYFVSEQMDFANLLLLLAPNYSQTEYSIYLGSTSPPPKYV